MHFSISAFFSLEIGPRKGLRPGSVACSLLSACLGLASIGTGAAASFDAAPFGLRLPEGNGVVWEDPREIHQVIVQFDGAAPPPSGLRLEYWGSRWPQQHLPKDRQPGGGDVGWMELGNWYNGGWRAADVEARAEGSQVTFSFRPVNEKEFPELKDYAARFRYTLKIRVRSEAALPGISRLLALTDSVYERRTVRLAWEQSALKPQVEVFNGQLQGLEQVGPRDWRITLEATANPDPNTLDRTLVTVSNGGQVFTFGADDVAKEPLFLPHLGVAVLAGQDMRDYAAVAARQRDKHAATLYDRVAQLPEQTWPAAWNNMPPKKSRICFPLGMDGGRQRFLLVAGGAVMFRSNDHYLQNRPGKDTPRLGLEAAPVWVGFGPLPQPRGTPPRGGQHPDLPYHLGNRWAPNLANALITELDGAKAGPPPPPADASAVFVARFVISNFSAAARSATLPLTYSCRRKAEGPARRRPGPAVARRELARTGSGRLCPRHSGGNLDLGLDLGAGTIQDGRGQAPIPGADGEIRTGRPRAAGLRCRARRRSRLLAETAR